MKISFLTEGDAKRTLSKLIRNCTSFSFAVAWAGKNTLVDEILAAHPKLTQAVIGTHMYQTDPSVLRRFEPLKAARCMLPSGRLFHPKVYLFKTKAAHFAVIGSHNLTKNAFEALNIEFSVLIEAAPTDAKLQELDQFIQSSWTSAFPIGKDDFLFSYETQHQIKRQHREALDKYTRLHQTTKSAIPPIPLKWPEFFRMVKAEQGHHNLDDRLAVLERAAQLFETYGALGAMDTFERKAIAGTYGKVEPRLDDLKWGFFGAMEFGEFKSLINKNSRAISTALDVIPLDGEITHAMYKKFSEKYRAAYAGKDRKGALATATRLLAMRRPDVFVAMTKANNKGICNAFGSAPTTTNMSNYWERIIEPMQNSLWWNAPRPRGALQARVWDNRAAFLDAIYYDPTTRSAG